tara:strand:- start:297 stop:437 length:141 start_codon:yes stop_codon:yes gene_type:complete
MHKNPPQSCQFKNYLLKKIPGKGNQNTHQGQQDLTYTTCQLGSFFS